MQRSNGRSHDNNGQHSQGVASGMGDRFGNGGPLPEPVIRGPKGTEVRRINVDPEAPRIVPGGYIPPDKRVTGKRFDGLPKKVRVLTELSILVDEAIKEVSGGASGNGHVVEINIDDVMRAMKARSNGASGLTKSAKMEAVRAAVAWRQHSNKITS